MLSSSSAVMKNWNMWGERHIENVDFSGNCASYCKESYLSGGLFPTDSNRDSVWILVLPSGTQLENHNGICFFYVAIW